MRDWNKSPSEWYEYPRSDRAFMKALTTASRLLEAMLHHDTAEEAKRKSEEEARRRKRR